MADFKPTGLSDCGLVLCTCPECMKVESTDPSGKQAKNDLWIHPRTHQRHRSLAVAGDIDELDLKDLAETFREKACVKDNHEVDACSEPDDIAS
ncbi:hypothetical protein CROQUDRAFT_699712 [Cronartium quercuum f. sp. fusiforme G11]|uniref:Uncharacterized protein n=1 Tax=Cronartium quercuum f. sp. fusiforme G11 TaxID=708437 RepID=A0A9P6TCT9_9BASI|nr:hypothetical protein CROQUDRAFT_699712 [Cronartium quercuum f. sp. fusiforme G11]